MLPVTTTVRLILFILGVSAHFLCPYPGYFFFLTADCLFRFLLFSIRFNLIFSPGYIPDLRSMVFQPDTILSPDSFPFLSVPTGHPPVLPCIPHSEILYQSISPSTITRICHFHSYIPIFLLSLYRSPLSIVFLQGSPVSGPLCHLQSTNHFPVFQRTFDFAFRTSPCLLSTGACHAPVIK